MARASLKEAAELQRKPHVPDHDRTPQRDETADCIGSYLDEHDWTTTTLTELADYCGCSREHVSNVLDGYYQPASEDRRDDLEALAERLEGDRGTDEQTAYRDGAIDMLSFLLENPEIIAPLLDRRD